MIYFCHFVTYLRDGGEEDRTYNLEIDVNSKLYTELLAAMKNHDAACPMPVSFDPEETPVEVHGEVPVAARGLIAFSVEKKERCKALMQEIENLLEVAKAADGMASQIIREQYPEAADRSGLVFGAGWLFFAIGPSDKRKFEAQEQKTFSENLEREMQRAMAGDDAVDEDDERDIIRTIEKMVARHGNGRDRTGFPGGMREDPFAEHRHPRGAG